MDIAWKLPSVANIASFEVMLIPEGLALGDGLGQPEHCVHSADHGVLSFGC